MNEIIENMKTRRSIRKFKSDALPQDVLDRILDAGTVPCYNCGYKQRAQG